MKDIVRIGDRRAEPFMRVKGQFENKHSLLFDHSDYRMRLETDVLLDQRARRSRPLDLLSEADL